MEDLKIFIKNQLGEFTKEFKVFKEEFSSVKEEISAIKEEISSFKADVDKRFDAVDKRFDAVDKQFDAVDKRFDAVDKRFDAVDKRFEDADALELTRLKNLEEKIYRKIDFNTRTLTDAINANREYTHTKIDQTNERIEELKEPIMSVSGAYADAMKQVEECKIENLALANRIDRLETSSV